MNRTYSLGHAYWFAVTLLSAHCTGAALPENNEASTELIIPLQMAERLLRAHPDSVANHVTDRSIIDRRALT